MSRYAAKTREELLFIIKDASEAALAMRDHDPVAEAKYLDQVNDACTELNKRKKPFIVIRSPNPDLAQKISALFMVVNAADEKDAVLVAADNDHAFSDDFNPDWYVAAVAYEFQPNQTYSG